MLGLKVKMSGITCYLRQNVRHQLLPASKCHASMTTCNVLSRSFTKVVLRLAVARKLLSPGTACGLRDFLLPCTVKLFDKTTHLKVKPKKDQTTGYLTIEIKHLCKETDYKVGTEGGEGRMLRVGR